MTLYTIEKFLSSTFKAGTNTLNEANVLLCKLEKVDYFKIPPTNGASIRYCERAFHQVQLASE